MALKGPLLQTAVFCETVIEGKDGVLSIIRVVDRIMVAASGADAPKDMPPVSQQVTAVLTFKAGSAKGRQEIRLEMEKPNTERRDVWTSSMFAEAPDRGQNFVLAFRVTFDLEGLYWFHVYADSELMTSMPLRLLYIRQAAGSLHPTKP
jgi:hypothetical protein